MWYVCLCAVASCLPTDARVSVPALPYVYACVACFFSGRARQLQTLIALCASPVVTVSASELFRRWTLAAARLSHSVLFPVLSTP